MDLGKDPDGRPFPFDAAELTRHTVVLGSTGSGKTGLVVGLVEEMLAAGVSVVAVDPKGDLARLLVGPLGTEFPWTLLAPGSRAGSPVSLLAAMERPSAGPDDPEGYEAALGDVARSVTSLAELRCGPMDPPELLVRGVVDHAWRAGRPLVFQDLVVQLVDPPFARLGVFPVDAVMPRADRLALAVKLNGWLASPVLAAFATGAPLDPEAFVARPSLTVLYLAHLDDALRRLAAGLLLSSIAGWSRRQAGSERPRLAVVLDEAWGFCPPLPAAPVTRRPLLALAKQGRAVGVALVSATQNPVDLDYALLSNAATWFVGRLATPQDREKVSDGASPTARAWLADLPKRTFLVRRSGREERLVTRDCRTPLGGPLTVAMLPTAASAPVAVPATVVTAVGEGLLPEAPRTGLAARHVDPSVAFAPGWLAVSGTRIRPHRSDGALVWEPALLARLRIRFDEGRTVVAEREELRVCFAGGIAEPPEAGLVDGAPGEGLFTPFEAPTKKELDRLFRDLVDRIVAGETERQWVHATTKLRSSAGEAREAFETRVRAELERRADGEAAKLEAKIRKEVDRLEERRRKAEHTLGTREADRSARRTNEVVGAGEALLGLLFGRKRSLTPIASRRSATLKADAALDRAEQELADLDHELAERQSALAEELDDLRRDHLAGLTEIAEVEHRLERDDVTLVDWSVVWLPVSRPV